VRVAAGWIACASALAQAPDTILFNGRIVTLDARSSVHQALAIRDGRIVALGTNVQISEEREVKEKFAGQGIFPRSIELEDFDSFIREDVAKLGALAKAVGAKAN